MYRLTNKEKKQAFTTFHKRDEQAEKPVLVSHSSTFPFYIVLIGLDLGFH